MGRPAPFPHQYVVRLADRRLTAAAQAPIAVGPPPQFGGSDTVWSPEELLVGAALECLWTTFEAFARRDVLPFADWQGTGVGVLDKGPAGPTFTSITLSVELTVAAKDQERAERLLRSAEHHCIISNALRPAVRLETKIHAEQTAPAASAG